MGEKPVGMVDRDRDWSDLQRIWRSERLELAFVVGRRRVGKSYLLAPFADAVDGIYYQATRRTEAEQLSALGACLAARFDDAALRHGAGLPSWEALFAYLVDAIDGAPFLLVLDEFPYLMEAAPALPSILQSLVDHALRTSRLKLVLAGSYITAMRRLEAADQPLHARRTARLAIRPFDHRDAATFTPSAPSRDKLVTYAAFGGLPGHLTLLDPSADAAANITHRILDPTARLFEEGGHHLDGFLTDAAVHYAILAAIAGGEQVWSRITSRVGKSSGSLSRPMAWLVEMELVERVVPVTEAHPLRTKQVRYRIRDPYLRFWHRFVAPIIHAGLATRRSPEALYAERVAPVLDDFLGPVFEEVCREHVWRGVDAGLPFTPERVGAWWDTRSRHEIDVVAVDAGGDVLCAECKWGEVDSHDLARLRAASAQLVAGLGGARAVSLALFAGRGTRDPAVRDAVDAGQVMLFGPDDLY